MSTTKDQTDYLTVCRPTGPALIHSTPRTDEAREAMHGLLDSFLDRGCALLMREVGCGGMLVAVGIVPLSPDEPEHQRRADLMVRALRDDAATPHGEEEGE